MEARISGGRISVKAGFQEEAKMVVGSTQDQRLGRLMDYVEDNTKY